MKKMGGDEAKIQSALDDWWQSKFVSHFACGAPLPIALPRTLPLTPHFLSVRFLPLPTSRVCHHCGVRVEGSLVLVLVWQVVRVLYSRAHGNSHLRCAGRLYGDVEVFSVYEEGRMNRIDGLETQFGPRLFFCCWCDELQAYFAVGVGKRLCVVDRVCCVGMHGARRVT